MQVYSQVIAITNRSTTSVEASIRPSSSDRYSVHPKQLKLKAGQSCDVEVRLKVTRFGQTEKAVHQGQRDAIHLKTPHFADQQFYVQFFLDRSCLVHQSKGVLRHQSVPPSLSTGCTEHQSKAAVTLERAKPNAAPEHAAGTRMVYEHRNIRLQAPGSPPSPVQKTASARSTEQHGPDTEVIVPSAPSNFEDGVHIALAEERAHQEQRNHKFLKVLQEKDGVIHELQVEHRRLHTEIRTLEASIEDIKQDKLVADRSAKASEAQLRNAHRELAVTVEEWQRKLSVREKELNEEAHTLRVQLTALSSQQAQHAASADDALKSCQKELQKERVNGLAHEEQRLRAEAESEALQRKLSAADQLILDLESQIQESSARSSAVVRKLQAEQQDALLKLQSQISELQDLRLLSDAERSDTVLDTAQQKIGPHKQHTHTEEENKNLQDRIAVLEAANVALENALLDGFDNRISARNSGKPVPTRLSTKARVLVDDEADNGRISSSCPTTPMVQVCTEEAACNSELQRLQAVVTNQENEIAAHHARTAKLESLHKLAQDSALACESELLSCQHALVSCQQDNQNMLSELQTSKIYASQLNSRITDLLAKCAATQSDSESNLNEVRQVYAKEISELQQAVAKLLQELSSTKQAPNAAQMASKSEEPGPADSTIMKIPMDGNRATEIRPAVSTDNMSGDHAQCYTQHVLQQSCTDAETALAILQQQLMIAEQAQSKAESSEKATLHAMKSLRSDLEQKVRTTAQDGQLRIQLLEETVQRLSTRGDHRAELTKLSTENSKLVRMNAKLTSDLKFAEERVQSMACELAATCERSQAETKCIPESRENSLAIINVLKNPENVEAAKDFHRMTARLVERAEAAELELATVSTELSQLKAGMAQSAISQTKGSNVIAVPSRALESKTWDTEHGTLLADYKAMSLEEAVAVQETKILQLQNSLAEAGRETAAARQRVSSAELRAQNFILAANESFMRQIRELRQEATSAHHKAYAADVQRQVVTDDAKQLEVASKAAEDEACKKQGELDAARTHVLNLEAELEAAARSALEASCTLEKKLCHAEALASERAMQLSVLTDTVEALQTSHHIESDQGIVNLTAQLVASRGCEASQRRRNNELLVVNERYLKEHVFLERARDVLQARCSSAEGVAKSLRFHNEEARTTIERLQQEVKSLESECVRLKEENEANKQSHSASDAECESLKIELSQSTSRHMEQQQQLRQEMKDALQSQQHKLLNALPYPPYLKEFCTCMQEVFDHEKSHVPEGTWQDQFIHRLKELVIAADKERCIAVTDSRIATDEAAAIEFKLQGVDRAREIFQQRASIYANQLALMTTQMEGAAHQARVQMNQIKEISQARIRKLHDELLTVRVQLKDVTSSLQSAAESEQARQQEVQELSKALRQVNAELCCAIGERAAMKIQLAGHSSAISCSIEEALAARDAEIKDYVCSHIVAQCRTGNDVDQLATLARQIAAAKVSESQLLASLTASEKQCDAHIMREQHLEAELARHRCFARSSIPSPPWLHPSPSGRFESTVEVQHQLSCKDQELHEVRCECVELRQLCERQRVQIKDLADVSDLQKGEIHKLLKQADTGVADACKSLQAQHASQKENLEAELVTARQSVDSMKAAMQDQEQESQRQLDEYKEKLEHAVQSVMTAEAETAKQADHEYHIAQLAQELSKAYAEISSLQSKLESCEGSIKLLESDLSAIERRCTSAPADEDTSKVACTSFTKQLLQSNLAQAEAHRRLKVAAREAMQYQQRLAEQSQRIQGLKMGCRSTRAWRRCVSADRCKPITAWQMGNGLPGSFTPHRDAASLSGSQNEGTDMIRHVETGVSIQLAKQQAEIDLLRKDLAAARCNEPHETFSAHQDCETAACPSDRVAQELVDQAGECIDILSHALEADSLVPVVDSQCSHPISLGARLIDLCNRLVEQCTQRASETKIARGDANSPVADIRLVESQRQVIASLTVRMQAALKQLAAAQQDNCRFRERLRVLRISIGDDDPASDSENSPLALDVALPGVLQPQGHQHVESSVDSTGLTLLLQSHLNVILQHQRQLTDELQNLTPQFCADQHVLLQPLQQSAQELAAMEATLHVLVYSSQIPHGNKQLTNTNGQSTLPREPLHPLAHSTVSTDKQVLEEAMNVDAVQEKHCTPQSEELHTEATKARKRLHKLEQKCRQLSRSADEASVLQSQLDLISKECKEWQRRYMEAKHELQRSTAAAASSKLEMQNRIHELEMLTISKNGSMGSQISQLEHQIGVLESDKETALQQAEDLTAEIVKVNKQASGRDQANETLQSELRDQQGVIEDLQAQLASTRKSVELEKQERMKLLDALRGTIQKVRAAGHEEENLQGEVSKVTLLLSQERHMRQQCEEEVAKLREDHCQLKNELCSSSKTLLDCQEAAKQQALQAQRRLLDLDNQVHSLQEQLDMAESAFARRLDDLSNSILGISEHMQFPREVIEEVETLDEQVKLLGASFHAFQDGTVQANTISCQRTLDAERFRMQKELVDLQVQLQECQECAALQCAKFAEAENLKLKKQFNSVEKEADQAKSEVTELKLQVVQLERQIMDEAACEDADRKQVDQRHREQLRLVQEGHENSICSMQSANRELKLQVHEMRNENSALLERVNAAEAVAEATASEMSQLESSLREKIQVLQGQHDATVVQMQSRIEQIQGEFCRYQQAKHQEICGLDARIRKLLTPYTPQPCDFYSKIPGSHKFPAAQVISVQTCATKDAEKQFCQTSPPGTPGELRHACKGDETLSMTTPAAPLHYHPLLEDNTVMNEQIDIGAAAAKDAILAAKREGEFEKILRTNAEADLAAVQQHLCQEKGSTQQLRRQLQEAVAQGEVVAELKEQLAQQAQQIETMRSDICVAHSSLKECKGELSRKTALWKSSQAREKYLVAKNDDLKKECEATASKLENARRALSRKSAAIAQLKQSRSADADCPDQPKRSPGMEAHVKELQAAVARKDEMLKQMHASRDACKHMEAQLSNAHQVHERAMGKLKSDLHRKQTLLTAAQEQAGRLRSDLQQVLQDNEREHVSTQGKCHAAKSQLAYAKKILQLLVNTTVDLCRLLLRTTNYMQSGSKVLCDASLAAQVCFGTPGMTGMQPDDVAELVGLTATEVSDLLGKTKQNVMPSQVESSGTVAHIASHLTAMHEAVSQVCPPKSPLRESSGLQVHLTALIAVMEAQARKSESSVDCWVAAVPSLARACTENPDAPCMLQDALSNAPKLQNVADQIDHMFMSSIEFYTDAT